MCCRFAPDLIWPTRRALTPCTGENCGGAEHKNTDWFQIQVWGPLAKFAATLKAGTPVIVEGKIKPETYTADGVEHKTFSIKADYIRKIDYSAPNEASESKAAKPAKKSQVAPAQPGGGSSEPPFLYKI